MHSRKIKVLHLLSSDRFSGAENVVIQIINMFNNDNIDMAYTSKDGPIREALEKEKINFYPLDKFNIKDVSNVINEFEPDIIHAHDVSASIIASFFSKNAQIISHMHVNHENMSKTNLKTLLYLSRSHKFKHVFWVSNSAFSKYIFKNKISHKSSVLYNVIDYHKLILESEKDLEKYKYDVVYLGRLSYQKNPERMINVLTKVIDKKRNLRVAVIGTGDLSDNIKQLVLNNGIQENVSFLGFQNNPFKILKNAQLMVMTSRYEGTPMCALEAMALGVPIVSTPTDGLADIIQDGITGYLSEDDETLAERILNIITSDKERQRLSINSIVQFNEINNINDYHEKLFQIYTLES